jgi:hypothetical protein
MGVPYSAISTGGEFMDTEVKESDAPFRLLSREVNTRNVVEGNFWPMHFHVDFTGVVSGKGGGSVKNWMTTMNIFQAPAKPNLYPVEGGHNFFRVSEWGTSVIRLNFRDNWLPQEIPEVGPPMKDNKFADSLNGWSATMGPTMY